SGEVQRHRAGPGRALGWPTSRLTTAPLGGDEAGPPRHLSATGCALRQDLCAGRDRGRRPSRAGHHDRLPERPSDDPRRVREAPRCVLSTVPRTTLAARLVGHLQGGVALSSGRGCRPPSSLPDAVHGPAMPRPTAPPTVGARPALRAGLRPANSLPSSAPSIDLTSCALRMYSACLDRGRGEVERVTTTSFPSDPETGARSAAVRAQACPAPSSLLVLQDARSGAWPRPQDVVAACPTSLPEPLHEPAVPRPTAAPNCGHEI